MFENIAPTQDDVTNFQMVLGYALDYPDAIQYLHENRTAAAVALTAQNLAPKKTQDPNLPRDYSGLFVFGGVFIFVGFVMGYWIYRR